MQAIDEYLAHNEVSLTPNVVCYYIREGQVLLGKRKKVSNEFGKNLYVGIGGKIEPGETPEQAVIRECEEEIKSTPVQFEDRGMMKFYFPHKPKWDLFMHIYLVTKWEGEPVETDPIKPEWFDIDAIPYDQMWEDNKLFVPHVLAGHTVQGESLFGEQNQVVDSRLSTR